MLITLLILCYIFNSKTDEKIQLFYYLIVFLNFFSKKDIIIIKVKPNTTKVSTLSQNLKKKMQIH